MQNDIISIADVSGYVDSEERVWLRAEDVARGFGFTTVAKSGNDVVRWSRVNEYLASFGYTTTVGKDSYLPENMIYLLGFKASNDTAKAFQMKLANDVLPAIRRHGVYATDGFVEKAISNPDFAIKVLSSLKEEREKRINAESQVMELSAKVSELKPKADYCDLILSTTDAVTITQIAADYNMSAAKMNQELHNLGIQWKVGGQWVLYAKYMTKGYVRSTTINLTHKDGTQFTKMNTLWTQKGRLFIYDKLKEKGILPLMEQKHL